MAFLNLAGDFVMERLVPLLYPVLLAYIATTIVHRLWLSPIAHIPGPKLAALTQLYEFYYDIVLGGQYTGKILALHDKYGPVVRISPWEVHIKVHDFHSELYSGFTRPREKWHFFTKQFGAPHSALATIDHNHHKMRRTALDPFFSIQTVRKLQPVIEERADALLRAFAECGKTVADMPLNLMYPYSAYTNDVINEYAFARSDHLIEKPEFGAAVTDSMLMGTHMGNLIKHAGWILDLVNGLPEAVSGRWVPGWAEFLKLKQTILAQIREIESTGTSAEKWQLNASHTTIFHELLSSRNLTAEEKTPSRLAQEGQILVQGGTLTTSWTLSLATFHLVNRPSTLRKLRDELFEAIPNPDDPVSLTKLENLPYLRAVVKEAFRLGIGTSSRLARIAPHERLTCRDPESGKVWTFEPGTILSMSPVMTVLDEKIFPDPKSFRPERWIENGKQLDKYFHIFGGGSRHCLGQFLAYAEVYLMVAKIFRRWGSGGVVGGSEAGDRRPGDVGVFKIFETTVRDCEMASDYFIPIPYKGSKGLRFVLETC